MQFKKPKFWDKNRQTIFSLILFPLSIIVYFVAKLKRLKKGKKFKFPIICIGNVYLGGTGKTPISIEIFKILSSINKKPVFIKKFYPYIDDEINILNKIGPVISEKSRIKSLKSLDNSSYEVALLDDGFQDTKFLKDLSIVCFNENNWIGNGNIIPSGPLRESLDALKYADCIMIKGKKDQKKERQLLNYNKKLQFFYFDYNIEIDNSIREKKFITFAGIGNPESFFELLIRKNLNVIKKISFPDHHKFTNNDLDKIINFANENNAIILTTEKDYERLEHKYKSLIYFTKLSVKIEKFDVFKNLIKKKI